MEKETALRKDLLSTVLIVKVSNGYLLYENEHEYRNPMNDISYKERKVFETKESLFEFLNHNI